MMILNVVSLSTPSSSKAQENMLQIIPNTRINYEYRSSKKLIYWIKLGQVHSIQSFNQWTELNDLTYDDVKIILLNEICVRLMPRKWIQLFKFVRTSLKLHHATIQISFIYNGMK